MSLYFVNSAECVVVALVFGHALEVLLVELCHLLLVVAPVAALRLHHDLDVLAETTKFEVSVLGQVSLCLKLFT